MKSELLNVSLRNNAIFIADEWSVKGSSFQISESSSTLAAQCAKIGYTFSEELLWSINKVSPKIKLEILQRIQEVNGVKKNWTPLIKQWNVPTGESFVDHLVTYFANLMKSKKGTVLPCSHVIPNNTFPIERYNGCPFCGTPFSFESLDYAGHSTKLTTLKLWKEDDMKSYLNGLLASPVALDATQIDSLKVLLVHYDFPLENKVSMKETLMIVLDTLIDQKKETSAGKLFSTPNDILRYLWYKHTGFLQIVEPRVIVNHLEKNTETFFHSKKRQTSARLAAISTLKLKFSRKDCLRYATWLNNIEMNIEKQCEIMHPKRGIWIRVIRALRLAEYSKRKGFENLARLLDTFYNQNYTVWQGRVNHFKLKSDEEQTFKLLKQRPGLFARSLFSTMLWFGHKNTLTHFEKVANELPLRLIFTLNMYAESYFDPKTPRSVKPLGGTNKRIPNNKYLSLYTDNDLKIMQHAIRDLSLNMIKGNFSSQANLNKTVFIDPRLSNIPISIGDRSETTQDKSGALMGTRFPVEGNNVRLFLQWGEGLPAQHLDMDLSCCVAYENKTDYCSYSRLVAPGCIHSGDIQRIPNKVGTAEYIELDLRELAEKNAKYVSFTCNAYTSGSLSPNLIVGWMNSAFPMKISANGVAFNPTAVQHQVRIQQGLTKGMVFGVLDVRKREIIWLESSFGGQIVQNLDCATIDALLNKFNSKLKIGELLKIRAESQNLEIVSEAENADEVYDMAWALNTAAVSHFFLN